MTERFKYHRGDGFTDNGKYITPYDVVYILNELNDENQSLKEQLSEVKADEKQLGISFIGYKQKVEETLQKRYNHLQKTQQETEKPPRYWQGAIMEIEVIADCLGVDLE